ncbi:MAG: hypothetical protein IKD37_00085 [Clostridia bacterium]|nr:hypothetical protein [Clostridia bacterium]
MKKTLYYLSPFVSLPLATLLFTFAVDLLGKQYAGIAYPLVLCAVACLTARFSPSRHFFDGWIALLVPLALFVLMFAAGFFDQGETYSRFDFRHACKVALQTRGLVIYALLAAVSGLSSARRWRIRPKDGASIKG